MSRVLLLLILTAAIVTWASIESGSIRAALTSTSAMSILGILCLYGMAHIFRIIRLALLTLDQRKGIFPLASVHALTAFPSSFLPFKIGELLRLSGFFYVYDDKRKALAVWLSERFGDILTISMFILVLYLVDVNIPPLLRFIFVLFILCSALGLCAYFALSKLLLYLNRHLVLSSHSNRGLRLLKISYQLRSLEVSIYRSLEGRFIGMLLLSIAIWSCEILAMVAFLRGVASNLREVTQHFMTVLSGGLPAELTGHSFTFTTYQSLTLAVLAAIFVIVVVTVRKIKVSEQ